MRTFQRTALLMVAVLLVISVVGCQSTSETQAPAGEKAIVRVLTMDQAAMSVDQMNEVATEFMAANPDITIEMTYVPYEQVHDKFVTGAATTPPAYDVVMTDVVWYDEFIKKGYLTDITDKATQEMKDDIFPTAWNVVTRNGKSYGMPWLLDTKYLFYNTDLLQQAGFTNPPKTWEELLTMAQAMKDQGLVEYPIVWSWAQAEAAICDFTALLYGNGGTFLDESGQPAFNNEQGVAVLEWMKSTIDNGLSNPASAQYLEGDVLNTFAQGKAAFALNWLFMYDVANFDTENSQVTGKVGITNIPVFESIGGNPPSASVDGSSGFSITATSPNVEAAWKYVTFLTSLDTQMKYSSNQLPIWATAYEGENLDTLKAASRSNPVTVPAFADQFQYAVLRPNIAYYQEGSTALQLALQEALTGQKTPQEALDAAAAKWAELAAQ
ncbi:MAG: extracellular solute-binding protein [Chloroflexi bacterium]|nr:extracellular solute-binding protein [Chloroflexota bacterium]